MTVPTTIYLFMGIYASAQLFQALMIVYIYFQINKENSETEIITEAALGKPSQKMSQLEYDMAELKAMGMKIVMPTAISFFLYYKFDIVRHFAIQTIMNLMQFYGEKLFKIFVLGQPATGDLKRPFKVEQNFLQNWLQEKTEDTEGEGKKKKDKKAKSE